MQEMRVQSLGQEDALEQEMATQSSIIAWRIPCREEPDGLWFLVGQRRTQLKQLSKIFHLYIREKIDNS